jgi:replicative DNA helicase
VVDGPEPPQDLIAEQSTLGACLISRDAIDAVAGAVRPEDFYKPAHVLIYQAILDLVAVGEPADPVTLLAELRKRGHVRRSGGAPYLHELTQAPPTAVNAAQYAGIVADRARQRKLIELGERYKQLGYTPATTTEEVDSLIAQAEGFFHELREPPKGAIPLSELIEGWRSWVATPEDVIATPWGELNEYLGGGLRRGKCYLIGGRPGAGKSLCGLNMALQAAEDGLSALVFSMEMKRSEIASRILAAGAWAEYGEIFRRSMTADTWSRVEEYIDQRQHMTLEVVDKSSVTVEEISATIRARQPDIAVIDYLQLITMTAGDSRREKIDHVSRTLKITAGDSNTALVVASQLNRAPTTGGRVPTIADLRESGGQEADADVVMLLHRPANDDAAVQMHIGKNRDGRQGTIEFVWRGNLARIG